MKWILAMVMILSGCTHIDAQYYGKADLSEKSMTVPAGNEGLKGGIKKYLASHEWRMAVDRGPNVITGKAGDETTLEQSATFKTKYRIGLTSSWVTGCMDYTQLYRFDFSLIDNQTGAEVFTMSGQGCEPEIIDKLNSFLLGKNE